MKVAIFCETYLPYLNGVVTHIKLLKESLEKRNHTVLVITADPNAKKHLLKDGVLYCPAVSSKRFYGYGLASPISSKRLDYIREFNPDICHIHQEFGIGAFGVMAAKMLKIPLVYTLHTMYEEYLYYVAPKPFVPVAKKILHSYSRLLANNSACLTGPSKKIENYFSQVGVDKQVNVIPNPVELNKFNTSNVSSEQIEEIKQKYNIPKNSTIAIFVGRLGKEKSVDVVLDYWKNSITEKDNLHFIIVGDGPAREDLIQQAEDLNISSMVTFVGKIPHDELLPYYAASNAYLTASLSEVHSISMLEGMSCGLPIIQRFDEGNSDQVIDGVNGYTFKNSSEMYNALCTIRDASDEEKQQLKDQIESLLNSFNPDSFAEYIINVYKSTIKNYDPDKKTKNKKRLISRIIEKNNQE